MDHNIKYPAANIPDDIKPHLARLYTVQRRQGKTRSNFVNDLCEAGLVVSASQLSRWVARINSGHEVISIEKNSGHEPALNREWRDVASGWVLNQNDLGIPVHLSSYIDFIRNQFSINISTGTASNYLREDGFAYRSMKQKGKSYVINVESMRSEAWAWVQDQNFSEFKSKLDSLCSVDFTFTGHRTERISGFGPIGGAQPMVSASISNYTNCIVTTLWGDGINRTPPILFTYNQEFRRDRNPTPRRQAQIDHLDECLALYGIDNDRIVYVGKDKGEKEHYVKECPELIRLFFDKYQVGAGVTALSDNGNSFFEKGESVFTSLGFHDHRCYPAREHQWLSPNDNPAHGTSKQSWRTSGVDYADDVASCLSLLYYLDRDINAYSKYWFDRNLISLTEEGLSDLIASRGPKKSHLHKTWLRAYRIWIGEDARGYMPELPDNLKDGLDGLYWEKP